MNVDAKIEIIRKALEGKFGQCSVNRGPIFAYFFVDKRPYLTLSKEFIEVLPLVDKKEKFNNP